MCVLRKKAETPQNPSFKKSVLRIDGHSGSFGETVA